LLGKLLFFQQTVNNQLSDKLVGDTMTHIHYRFQKLLQQKIAFFFLLLQLFNVFNLKLNMKYNTLVLNIHTLVLGLCFINQFSSEMYPFRSWTEINWGLFWG